MSSGIYPVLCRGRTPGRYDSRPPLHGVGQVSCVLIGEKRGRFLVDRFTRFFFFACFAVLICAPNAKGQNPCSTTSLTEKEVCTIPQVFGPAGLSNGGALATVGSHAGHFESDFTAKLAPLNSAVATQLVLLPLASPASGIGLTFDASLGVFVASNDSFGPVLSERATTLGRHRFFVGVSYQYFNFNTLDGLNLKNLPAVFTHENDCLDSPNPCPAGTTTPNLTDTSYTTCSVNGGVTSSTGNVRNTGFCSFVRDYIQTTNRIDLKIHQTAFFVSFGLTSRIDVSVAIPIVDVRMAADSVATIVPQSLSGDHVFPNPSAAACVTHPVPSPSSTCYNDLFSNANNSLGIGDITLRAKGTVWKGEHNGIAAGVDVRLPSGDALNFQGAGAVGANLFGVWSYSGRISPHVNAGYEWNGNSILAGDLTLGTKARLPNQFFYSAGVEAGIVRRLTAAVDIIGQRVFNGQTMISSSATVLGACAPGTPFPNCPAGTVLPPSTLPTIAAPTTLSSYNVTSAGVGLRYNPFGRLLISANALFKLDEGGLRANVVPLVSISYTFK
jgi:hypothetical protein